MSNTILASVDLDIYSTRLQTRQHKGHISFSGREKEIFLFFKASSRPAGPVQHVDCCPGGKADSLIQWCNKDRVDLES